MQLLQRSMIPGLFLFFIACNNNPHQGAAPSNNDWTLTGFIKNDTANPIMAATDTLEFDCPMQKTKVRWAEKDVFNPAAIVRNDTLFLLFRAEDMVGRYAGTSRIGIAWSLDGIRFTAHPQPVLYPAEDSFSKLEWEGGCEDPRVIQDEQGSYYMMYTAYDGDKARLMVASSPDLFHWTKHGNAFAHANNPKYAGGWSKSGAVVTQWKDGKQTAVKIDGKYWMYWGDQNIWAATSDDLIRWEPVLYGTGDNRPADLRGIAKELPELKTVFGPRKGSFDSDLVEPGPPAILTDHGILLMYNSRNIPSIGDSTLAEGTYTAAQALMDREHPTRLIARMDRYFLKPEKDYEIKGQVNHVCFIEGLVPYKGKWFLYYGTADSKIAVATRDHP
jgi:beta-1,2-mannosidase